MTNLATRSLVALAGIPLLVAAGLAGGFWFLGLVLLLSGVSLGEFYGLARARGTFPQIPVGIAAGALIVCSFAHGRIRSLVVPACAAAGVHLPTPSLSQTLLILLLAFVLFVLVVELFRDRPAPLRNIGVTLFGVLYVSLFFGSLVGLREIFNPSDFPVYRYFGMRTIAAPAGVAETIHRWGGGTVVSLMVSVWLCDTAAYAVGTRWGKRPLLPRVSPRKSWEGAIAGFAAAVSTFTVAGALWLPYLSPPTAVLCGALVGIFGQVGDMVESLLKRDAGVKDSSGLIPGHGGVLDRFDSLAFTAPVFFLLFDFVLFSIPL
ncbi:MAG: phosphatidate cytidylyltransferase [Bacteroidota bacterium]